MVPGVAAVALVLHHGRVEADAGLEGGVTHRPAQSRPRPHPRQLGQHQGRDARRSHANIRGEVSGRRGLREIRFKIFLLTTDPYAVTLFALSASWVSMSWPLSAVSWLLEARWSSSITSSSGRISRGLCCRSLSSLS